MTRIIIEEPLSGEAIVQPVTLERAIRAVCRDGTYTVQVPLRFSERAGFAAQYEVRTDVVRAVDELGLNEIVLVARV